MALGDMFLKVESATQGTIKGESPDATHPDEIQLVSWSWGMRSNTSLGGAGPTGKTTLNELNVIKRVDSASTALMSAMRNNDKIKKATLTVRKAGLNPLEYLVVTVEDGRITSMDVDSGHSGDETEIQERLSFAYKKINVEYKPQGADGQPRGATVFNTEID